MKTTYEFAKELIQQVNPTDSYKGENYEAWKKEARKKLSLLLGMDKFTKVAPETEIEYTEKIDGGVKIRFSFQSESGYRVPGYLLLPDGIEKPPVIICLQGHSTGMHISIAEPKYEGDEQTISGGDRDFCVRAIKEGFAAIALEQRNFGEMGQTRCHEPSMTNLLMGRTTVGERVWDISRLIDVIETEFSDKVDAECISLMGNSGGGTATAYTAALEDRIVLAMPSCAMCTYKDSIGAMHHCACNYVPNIANVFDMGDLMAMACPKYFIQVSGKEDNIFPLFAARKVFEDGKCAYSDNGIADRVALVEGDGGHRFYADPAWPIVHKFLGR